MRRIKSALLVTVLTCGLVVTPVFAEPSVDDLKKDKEAAQSEVDSLQSKLTDLLSKISQLEGDLISKGQEITQAEEDLAAAQEKEEEQYEAMKLRIKFMYEEGDTSVLETLVSAKDFSDLVNKAEYVQNVHSYDRKMLEEYVATKQQVQDLKSTLETEMDNLENMQAEFESDKKNLDATLASKAAYSQLGVPYVWGGTQPGVGLDCSGLVQYCHAVAGISLPHYSESQYAGGRKVSSPEPGDICWKPGHVGIYIGGGMMIEAQQTGTNIMISPVRAQGYARYW